MSHPGHPGGTLLDGADGVARSLPAGLRKAVLVYLYL